MTFWKTVGAVLTANAILYCIALILFAGLGGVARYYGL